MRKCFWSGIVALCGLLGAALPAMGADVAPGWELFETTTGTTFPGIGSMEGVPLGTFDFGGTTGVQSVGLTDTIVQRMGTALPGSLPGTATVPIEIVALQLQSVAPLDFGGNGLDHYYLTLQSVRGGPQTVGSMSINFDAGGNSGTFNSFFDVFFDIRKGSLSGPIVLSNDVQISGNDTWNRNPPSGAILIDGVNHFLNGTDLLRDFWPGTPFGQGNSTNGIVINDTNPIVPLPSAASSGLLFLGAAVVWRLIRTKARTLAATYA
jgi:hypothetical protein